MEKSVKWEFDTYMQELFQMKEVDIKEYSPLTLAYIGDSIYDLIIKSLVVNEGNRQVQKLHKETITDYRRATGFEALMGYLYLKKEWKRMLELVKIGLESMDECI